MGSALPPLPVVIVLFGHEYWFFVSIIAFFFVRSSLSAQPEHVQLNLTRISFFAVCTHHRAFDWATSATNANSYLPQTMFRLSPASISRFLWMLIHDFDHVNQRSDGSQLPRCASMCYVHRCSLSTSWSIVFVVHFARTNIWFES